MLRRLALGLTFAGLVTVAACDPASRSAATATPGRTATRPTTVPVGPDGKVHLTDAQWKARLTPEQYDILRQKGTEYAGTGKYDNFFQAGTYQCAACGQELFTSTQKYDSGCGWPAFSAAAATGSVLLLPDADGHRTEVECSRCGSHLGHVFDDGPPPTGQRYCIDSAALVFVPAATPTTAPAK